MTARQRVAALLAEAEDVVADAHPDAHRDLAGAALYLRRALDRQDVAVERARKRAEREGGAS